MDLANYMRFIAALVFVLALIGLATWLARRFGFGPRGTPMLGGERRLSVIESTTIDSKHRAVLIRRDEVEHLVLLGAANDLVIETGIPARPAAASRKQGDAAGRTASPASAAAPVTGD